MQRKLTDSEVFGFSPVIAMLSFSNFGSAVHDSVEKVSNAVKLLNRCFPDLTVDGPLQSDFALNKLMLKNKFDSLNNICIIQI